ncbi:hypothetical protein N786_08120 [Bacillus amyloliquefaciens UASWS BA1]|nr:hypothetical protein N786_08120 [Bacillus amyloliquefaciens UASWS BA1]
MIFLYYAKKTGSCQDIFIHKKQPASPADRH